MTTGTGVVLASIATAAAAAAGSIVEIERVEVTQSHATTSQNVRLAISDRDATGTLTVTAATPAPLLIGAPASGIAGGTNALTAAKCGINSSADSGGTYVDHYYCNPNNQGGFVWQPIPEHKLVIPPSKIMVVRLLAAATDTAGWTVCVFFHEVF